MLKLTHISKTFNPSTVNAKKAIEDLSFHAAKGDFITVIGANGESGTVSALYRTHTAILRQSDFLFI